jgi:hypothetical protein
MGSDDVFSADMPEGPGRPIEPVDADTAERLLAGRLDPDDAPPGYAEVARLLGTAAAPADASELTGEAAAMAAFRLAQRPPQPGSRPIAAPGRLAGGPGRRGPGGVPARATGRRGRVRPRLAALALAGAVAVAGVGVWTAGGLPFSRELRSPSGGANTGGSGSGAPTSAVTGSSTGGGTLRPASPGLGSGQGAASVPEGRPPSRPSARERATAGHSGGVTAHGSGSPHGGTPNRPARQPKPKPEKPTPEKPKPESPRLEHSNPETPKRENRRSGPPTPEHSKAEPSKAKGARSGQLLAGGP